VLRHLERCDVAAQRRNHLRFVDGGAGLRHDGGRHRFAEIGIGHADHRRFSDAGKRVDPFLDLLRIDIEAAADDQVLRASDEAQVTFRRTVRHPFADVAGAKPAVGGELLARLVG
jgi:hypothetical protein